MHHVKSPLLPSWSIFNTTAPLPPPCPPPPPPPSPPSLSIIHSCVYQSHISKPRDHTHTCTQSKVNMQILEEMKRVCGNLPGICDLWWLQLTLFLVNQYMMCSSVVPHHSLLVHTVLLGVVHFLEVPRSRRVVVYHWLCVVYQWKVGSERCMGIALTWRDLDNWTPCYEISLSPPSTWCGT